MSQLPATELTIVGEPEIVDDRARFRALFCETLRESHFANPKSCDTFLWRLFDESASVNDRERAQADTVIRGDEDAGRARVLIYAGAFGDCFPPWSTPFADSIRDSEDLGFDIRIVPVSGRSSSDQNAIAVRNSVLAVRAPDDEPLILVGYSKGAVDVLEALVRYPEVAARVTAVVSISGAINGSPLAARYRNLYDSLLRKRRIGACGPGDGGVLESLQRPVRLSWLSHNPLPRNVHYYSIISFASPPRVARILRHMQRILSKASARNDGQLLAEDQFIPGSALLGFVNADHWAVALRMEDRFPVLAHRSIGTHPFPRSVLLESALRFVRRDLRDAKQANRPAQSCMKLYPR